MSDSKSHPNSNSDNVSSLGIVVELPLKFNFHTCMDPEMDLSAQNKLAFDIVDTFSYVDSSVAHQAEHRSGHGVQHDHSVQNRVLEKKLNLVLQLLNTLLVNLGGTAQVHPLKLSAQTIEWDNAQFQSDALLSLEKGQNIILDVYPASELPYPIKRCGVIANITGSIISAEFYPLDTQNQERFEKWIFQLHRRSLQHKDH